MVRLRRYLIAGLLVWLPLAVTVVLIRFLFEIVDQTLQLLPPKVQPDRLLGFHLPGVGAVLVLAVLLLTGVIATNLFGRNLVRLWEELLAHIPVVRAIYSAAKQLTETLFGNSATSFRKVLLVQYPRAGMWTLAFLTGEGTHEVNRKTGQDLVHIFVPTTPNPTAGFFLIMPRSEAIELDMSVDAGIKLILSAGAVGPDGKKNGGSVESDPMR
ncbi:MAG: DUF502 domain-containing protein [Acidiferrobacterales bacterium]